MLLVGLGRKLTGRVERPLVLPGHDRVYRTASYRAPGRRRRYLGRGAIRLVSGGAAIRPWVCG